MDEEINYISHYGVLGMKWGVRRGRRSTKSGRNKYRESRRAINKDALKKISENEGSYYDNLKSARREKSRAVRRASEKIANQKYEARRHAINAVADQKLLNLYKRDTVNAKAVMTRDRALSITAQTVAIAGYVGFAYYMSRP